MQQQGGSPAPRPPPRLRQLSGSGADVERAGRQLAGQPGTLCGDHTGTLHRSATQPIRIKGHSSIRQDSWSNDSEEVAPWPCYSQGAGEPGTGSVARRQSQHYTSESSSPSGGSKTSCIAALNATNNNKLNAALRPISKWSEKRQSSFSSYLTESRKESLGNKEGQDTLSSSTDESSVGFLSLQRTQSVPVVRNKKDLSNPAKTTLPDLEGKNTAKKRSRKETVKHAVYLPSDQIELPGDASDDPNVFTSIETLYNTWNNNSQHTSTSLNLSRDKILPDDINSNTQTSTRTATSFESAIGSTKHAGQPIVKLASRKVSDAEVNCVARSPSFDGTPKKRSFPPKPVSETTAGQQPTTHITRVGGVRFSAGPSRSLQHSNSLENDRKSGGPSANKQRNSVPSNKPSSTAEYEHSRVDYKVVVSHLEKTDITQSQVHQKIIHVGAANPRADRNIETATNELAVTEKIVSVAVAEEGKIASKNQSRGSKKPEKKLLKSSSTSTFRFLSRGLSLPAITARTARSTPEAVSRAAFFSCLSSPLSPELADYLYTKMKGVHDGILVTACRLAEEDQVLRLIRELTTSGQLGDSLLNQRDKAGRTALSYASVHGYTRAVAALTGLPAIDLNLADTEGNTALHLAAQAGHAEVVSHLVNKCARQVDLDARNGLGFTPLMKAALQGRTKIAKTLLFAGASPHLRDWGRGLSAVQWARFTGRHLCCDLIESVERSCSAQIRDRWTSDPDLNSATCPLVGEGQRESWLRSKFKKAFNKADSRKEFSVASNLSTLAMCATSPLLPVPAAPEPVRPSTVPTLQVTEVKVADCYHEPREASQPGSSPPTVSTTKSAAGGGAAPTTRSGESSSKVCRAQSSPVPGTRSQAVAKAPPQQQNMGETGSPPKHQMSSSVPSGQRDQDSSCQRDQASHTSSSHAEEAGSSAGQQQGVITVNKVVTGTVYSKGASVYAVQKSSSDSNCHGSSTSCHDSPTSCHEAPTSCQDLSTGCHDSPTRSTAAQSSLEKRVTFAKTNSNLDGVKTKSSSFDFGFKFPHRNKGECGSDVKVPPSILSHKGDCGSDVKVPPSILSNKGDCGSDGHSSPSILSKSSDRQSNK